MKNEFQEDVQAFTIADDNGRVQSLSHFDNPVPGNGTTAQAVAQNYLQQMGETLGLVSTSLQNMSLLPEEAVTDERPELRFESEKEQFDNSTVSYLQTAIGLPVWGASVSVQIKNNPYRVLNSTSTVHENINVQKPSKAALKKYKTVSEKELRDALSSEAGANATVPSALKVVSSTLYVYQYKAEERLLPPDPLEEKTEAEIELPPVPQTITEGAFYVVSAVTFEGKMDKLPKPYIALIEVETGAVLYLRSFSSDLTGLVFKTDPFTTGVPAATPAASNAVLNPVRSAVTLPGLVGPSAGVQKLKGNWVEIKEIEAPVVASPTLPAGLNFNYNARTNEFAAVSAYYHNDNFFRFVTGLGFPASYWGTTAFPLPVDHRGMGNAVNAHCVGNGSGGIGHACYALADSTNPANPLGIAADWRVVLHELGGHGVLYCHVNSPNFGFAHSAGDSMAAIVNDPGSLAPDRFVTFPWVNIGRRHDRSVAAGWAWGGTNDIGGYSSEQILCTTLFRIYRSIGGDAGNLSMKRFASRFTAYLILRTIGNLTPFHATQTAATSLLRVAAFANEMISANLGDWTSEGLAGGAYGKVIRWAFEKQGLYQAAGATPPFTTAGKPPAVDVYINDGRNGEYTYQPVHWANTNIWNRRAPDGGAAHQEPIVGATNYAYVKIKNRGTATATGVVVKGFHCQPGAGLTWPIDWKPMATPQLAAPNVAGNNAAEIVVGPFKWIPSQLGHECMMMVASAIGDPSNINNFGAGDTIPEWRLVPHDNNIGQRNVSPVAGAGGLKALIESLQGRVFNVRNPLSETADVTFEIALPKLLADNGVKIDVPETTNRFFKLQKGEARRVSLKVSGEKDMVLPPEELKRDPFIHVKVVANDQVIGGMSYYIDTQLEKATGGNNGLSDEMPATGSPLKEAIDKAVQNAMADNGNLANVRVRKINIDLDFNE